jgi:hypothetical protein
MELRKQANNHQRTLMPYQPGREKEKGRRYAQNHHHVHKFLLPKAA